MTDFELSLPKDSRLNQLLDPADMIHTQLDEEIWELHHAPHNGDVIDIAKEISTAEHYAKNAEMICSVMFNDTSQETFEAVYRALTFYRQVAGMIYGEDNNLMNQAPYLAQLGGLDARERFRILSSDVHAYFDANRNVEAMVLDYAYQVDDNRGKHGQVFLVGGYVCMLSERTQGQRFMDEQAVVLLDGLDEPTVE